jgi:uncharacterized protein YecE (DUF72 family)
MMADDNALIKQPAFYYGTSNVALPVRNKGYFPPEFQDKSRLCYYASIYNSVEINSSFYKIPMRRTVEKWAAEVPEKFVFTFKLYRNITHAKELRYESADIQRYLDAINGVDAKKGCILVQFAPSIKRSLFQSVKQIVDELRCAQGSDGWKIAVEFRDKSWYDDRVYQFLEQHEAIVVTHDIPASATPLIDMEADSVYLRFHGENGRYRGTYTDDFLQEYASYIREWVEDGKTVYAYFNNTMGQAAVNAITLRDLLQADNQGFEYLL